MRGILTLIAGVLIFIAGCKQRNHVYSTASFDKAYEYDPNFNYRGYQPNEGDNPYLYRTYQPDPNNGMTKKYLDEIDTIGI